MFLLLVGVMLVSVAVYQTTDLKNRTLADHFRVSFVSEGMDSIDAVWKAHDRCQKRLGKYAVIAFLGITLVSMGMWMLWVS